MDAPICVLNYCSVSWTGFWRQDYIRFVRLPVGGLWRSQPAHSQVNLCTFYIHVVQKVDVATCMLCMSSKNAMYWWHVLGTGTWGLSRNFTLTSNKHWLFGRLHKVLRCHMCYRVTDALRACLRLLHDLGGAGGTCFSGPHLQVILETQEMT